MNQRGIPFKLFIAGLFVFASSLILQGNPETGHSLHATGVYSKSLIFERLEPRLNSGSLSDLFRHSRPNFLSGFYVLSGNSTEHGQRTDSAFFDLARIGVLHFSRPLYILLKIFII
jgi:hypothetical protein